MIEIRRSAGSEDTAHYVATRIATELQGVKKVLLFVPGGSGVDVAMKVSAGMEEHSLKNLTVMQTDERYGEVWHKDSNWTQLCSLGKVFSGATLLPVLSGRSFEETIAGYEKDLQTQLSSADISIGLFGMGSDGHTAGILPRSTAAYAKTLAHGYYTPKYLRITMTAVAIRKIDEVIIFAMGNEKKEMLERLHDGNPKEEDVPAQTLKSTPKLTVFTDAL